MKGHLETQLVATAAVLFGVVFGILFLACEQREDEPDARTDTPASAKAKPDAGADAPAGANALPDSPPAPSASKATGDPRGSFTHTRNSVNRLGKQLEGFRGKATGDLGVALGELEAKQAQLMAELEAIGGENEKWDAARKKLKREVHDLRKRVHEFAGRVNG